MTAGHLPHLNAALNLLATLCLSAGYVFVRTGRIAAHRAAMLAALVASALFLASYAVYHARVGSVPFEGTGWVRPVYFTILVSHIVLAVAIVPLAGVTVARALAGRFDRHRRIARVTLPIWWYVSATGVAIYWMLYHMGR